MARGRKSYIYADGQRSDALTRGFDERDVKPQFFQKNSKERSFIIGQNEHVYIAGEDSEHTRNGIVSLSVYLAKRTVTKKASLPNDYQVKIESCINAMEASHSAWALLLEAAREGWSIGLGDLWGHDFHIDVPERFIILDDGAFGPSEDEGEEESWRQHNLTLSFIRALRDIWQEKRHADYTIDYTPEAILMIERIRAADCCAIAALCAWEMRENCPDLWGFVMESEDSDIAGAFHAAIAQKAAQEKTDVLKALRAGFFAWHRSESHVTACDHESLEYLDSLLLCEEPQQRHKRTKKAASAMIELLSCLPDKTAYLMGYGQDILGDPHFAGLNDPINQSHFMQIMRDLHTVTVQGVSFRDPDLAGRIFPGGRMTPELEPQPHSRAPDKNR